MKGLALIAIGLLCASSLHASPLYATLGQADIDAYRALAALDKRLATTGYKLAQANAPFCKNRMRNPGWVLHSYRQYPDRDTAKAAFAFPTPVAIAAIVDGGPADKAALRVGEGFTDLPGGILWGEEPAKHTPSYALIESFNQRVQAVFASSQGDLRFPVAKATGEAGRWVTLNPPPICASQFEISTGDKADAGADGAMVRISVRLAEFVSDEDEFAFFVAHELAHNILGHRDFLDSKNVDRGLGRMFGKSKKLIRQTEVEADQLAIWLMANTGYRPQAALSAIEGYDKKFGHGLLSDGTHYRWRQRVEIMRREIATLSISERSAYGFYPPLLKDNSH